MSNWLLRASILFIALTSPALAQCGTWDAGFATPDLNGTVFALAVFDDGSGPALYAGGDFTSAGDTNASYIARWNGTSWSALGSGLNNRVRALRVFDDGSGPALYAGGQFTTAGGASALRIAKWNGASWSALGSGMNDLVRSLEVFDSGTGPALYAGGSFTAAGSTGASHLAKWNGTSWSSVFSLDDDVFALRAFDDGSGPALYVGGGFSAAGTISAHGIVKWNGAHVSALGSGVDGDTLVFALEVFDGGSGPALYAGGAFTSAGGNSANRVAKWNGSGWSSLGSGMNSWVTALCAFDDGTGPALYAGGLFGSAGGTSANGAARWNGSSWSALGSGFGVDGDVYAFQPFDGGSGAVLHAGGGFTISGGAAAHGIARWSGSGWSGLSAGNGVSGGGSTIVRALETFDDGSGSALFAGGYFTTTGNSSAIGIAKWNGTSWSPLGNDVGLDSAVFGLKAFDDGSGPALFAAGSFTDAGGVGANNIAKWNGTAWSALGSGVDGTVNSLQVFDDGSGPALYAGGIFTTAGGVSAVNIAKWNGAAWSALGTGLDGEVRAMAVFDDGSGQALYAGGLFTTAGGVTANEIAKWNGSSWSAVGTGTNNTVAALEVFDDGSGPALYAAGSFTAAGGTGALRIAKWNGSSWSAVGTGTNSSVAALEVFDDGSGPALYAGGSFTSAGGSSANRIAKWNGAFWSTLAEGISGPLPYPFPGVFALRAFDDGHDADLDLFAGGRFSVAGTSMSNNIAQWHGCGTMSFCFGDGSSGACPCANNGVAGHGCDNSSSTGGALLAASGTASLAHDSVLFNASGEKPTALSILAQGQTQVAAVPFGQGLRCVAGNLKRLYVEHAVAGAFSAPTGMEPNVHARSAILGDTIAAGSSRYYYAYYRDATVLGGCSPASTFNSTHSVRLIWAP